MIRVVVAEDSPLMRRLLVDYLRREPDIEVIAEAINGAEAVEFVSELRPDVVLLDLEMPVLNGAEAARRIRAQIPQTRIVVITAYDQLASVGQMVGAHASLDKSCQPEELAETLRRVAQAGADPDEGAQDSLGRALELLSDRFRLTERERLTIECLVRTDLTLRQIATHLTKALGTAVSESSVKHSLERALGKLQVEPRTRAALTRLVLETASAAGAPENLGSPVPIRTAAPTDPFPAASATNSRNLS